MRNRIAVAVFAAGCALALTVAPAIAASAGTAVIALPAAAPTVTAAQAVTANPAARTITAPTVTAPVTAPVTARTVTARTVTARTAAARTAAAPATSQATSPVTAPVTAPAASPAATPAARAHAVIAAESDDAAPDCTVDPGQQDGRRRVVIDRGHVDFGPTLTDGVWRMALRDDTGERSCWRRPEDVVIRLGSSSIIPMPDNADYAFLGEPSGTPLYVVPQTQNPDVAWVGWNTQEPAVAQRLQRGMTLTLDGVDGPAGLDVYLENGDLSAPTALFSTRAAYPQDSFIEVNMHTHVNWVFHAPGVYRVRLTLAGMLDDGTQVSDTNELRFAVGDETDPSQAFDGSSVSPDGTGSGAGAAGTVGSQAGAQTSDDAEHMEDVDDAAAGGDRDRRERIVMIGVTAGALAVGWGALLALSWLRSRRARRAALSALGEAGTAVDTRNDGMTKGDAR